MNQALVGRARVAKNAAALPTVVPPVPAVEGRVAAQTDRRLVVAEPARGEVLHAHSVGRRRERGASARLVLHSFGICCPVVLGGLPLQALQALRNGSFASGFILPSVS